MTTIAAVTGLLTAVATVLVNAAVLIVALRGVKRRQDDTHAVVKAVANGQAARVDQLEQELQAAGAPIPPAPPVAAETGSEPI